MLHQMVAFPGEHRRSCPRLKDLFLVAVLVNSIPVLGQDALDSAARSLDDDNPIESGSLAKHKDLLDYSVRLDNQLSQGVTRDNNAVVLLLSAFDPKVTYRALSKHDCEAYLKMLGITSLSTVEPYFVTDWDYFEKCPGGKELLQDAEGRLLLSHQSGQAITRAWSYKEFPILAGWLKVNEKPLELILEASKRRRYFDPVAARYRASLSTAGTDRSAPDPYWSCLPVRQAARLLAIRAMAELHAQMPMATWRDLLACHHLARLLGQAPASVDARLAYTIEAMALRCDCTLLQDGSLNPQDIQRVRQEFDALAPIVDVAERYGTGDRYSCLSWASRCRREGLESLQNALAKPGYSPIPIGGAARKTLEVLGKADVDWTVVFRTIDSCFDDIVAAQRVPTYGERVAAIESVLTSLVTSENATDDSGGSSEVYSRQIGRAFVFARYLETAFTTAHDRVAMDHELVRLAFALAQYHCDRGCYPEQLSELEPRYVAVVPKDCFSNSALRYRLDGDGYLLYSVGINGKDDDGRTTQDSADATNAGKGAGDWDDLVVRIK